MIRDGRRLLRGNMAYRFEDPIRRGLKLVQKNERYVLDALYNIVSGQKPSLGTSGVNSEVPMGTSRENL